MCKPTVELASSYLLLATCSSYSHVWDILFILFMHKKNVMGTEQGVRQANLRWRDTVLMRFMTYKWLFLFLAKSICADGVAMCTLFVYR